MRSSLDYFSHLLFAGYAAGPRHSAEGDGSNFLCLHEDPQWKTYLNGNQTSTAIYGVQHELYIPANFTITYFLKATTVVIQLYIIQLPEHCAMCYAGGRATIGYSWFQQEHSVPTVGPPSTKDISSQKITVTENVAATSVRTRHRMSQLVAQINKYQAFSHPVEVHCESLPCSVYTTGRELTCVVALNDKFC